MKIYGVGTDIVSIDRIKKSVKNKKFLTRVFNSKEISKCNSVKNLYHCFAKRFAAKEAFSKAFGTGISRGINLNEIIVQNNNAGKPYLIFEGDTQRLIKKKFKSKKIVTSLSLSDDSKYAVAFVTISL
tara:strand:+ start:147 stop:530 length:384 start_codon:yes stop_codon:yes gene_type:complete